tara:strand:- start:9684 stop:10136 length:453 start_codon:yes stop_codon:yes gene_type:complete
MEKQIETQMHKAFWDLISNDLSSEPQKFEHLIILINEIKEKLKSFTPNNKQLKTEIEEALDPEFLKNIFENKALEPTHFFNLILFLIKKLKDYCSPERDSDVKLFETETFSKLNDTLIIYSEFIPWFFKELYKHLDFIQNDINQFLKQLP